MKVFNRNLKLILQSPHKKEKVINNVGFRRKTSMMEILANVLV